MTDSITITIPEINPETISALQTAEAQQYETVVAALAAIRAKYAPLAKHNGYVRTAYSYRGDGPNWREEKETYYEDKDGEQCRALLACDAFDRTHAERNRGQQTGDRLYLLASGEWLEISRKGNWSTWQGESEGWNCGEPATFDDREDGNPYYEDDTPRGSIRTMTDAEVAEEYKLDALIADLSKSLTDLAAKIPERMTRVQKTTAIAAQLLAALK